MPADLADSGFVDGDDRYIATQQKAIYTWYESRHSDEEVVDIYSPEWQNRVNEWYNNLDTNQLPTETVKSWKTAEEIDFRVFFFAHPVATFSLWHILQALYEIDDAVCGKADDAQTKLAEWRAMRPFEYLKSPHVRHKWKDELKRLNKEIKSGLLTREKLKSRMYDILDGVEKLEVSLASLNEDFDFEQGEIEQGEEILNTIRGVIDDRCNLIVKILNVARSDGYIISTEDEAYDESLGAAYSWAPKKVSC